MMIFWSDPGNLPINSPNLLLQISTRSSKVCRQMWTWLWAPPSWSPARPRRVSPHPARAGWRTAACCPWLRAPAPDWRGAASSSAPSLSRTTGSTSARRRTLPGWESRPGWLSVSTSRRTSSRSRLLSPWRWWEVTSSSTARRGATHSLGSPGRGHTDISTPTSSGRTQSTFWQLLPSLGLFTVLLCSFVCWYFSER